MIQHNDSIERYKMANKFLPFNKNQNLSKNVKHEFSDV